MLRRFPSATSTALTAENRGVYLFEPLQDVLSAAELLRSSKRVIRELRSSSGLRKIRIAILGGSTTQEVATFLEIFLLKNGFAPDFWQSEYGRYYEDSVLDPSGITEFSPDLIYIHTTNRNIRNWPRIDDDVAEVMSAAGQEISKLTRIWDALDRAVECPIIQNNFEMPDLRLLGNLDGRSPSGATRFIHVLNQSLNEDAGKRPNVLVNDLHYLSAQLGLQKWYDWGRWFSYKLASSAEGSMATAHSLSGLILARYGLSKKCLILDLDNTLWGGVIGDDGADRIVIGRETAQAEAYTFFQEYCRALKDRGVILAVCSKNDEEIAKQGFEHPDSVLKVKDFACFKANWEPKHENIRRIAEELSLGVDSFVFVDDNPAERALVRAQLPMVAVPEVGEDVSRYARTLDRLKYFEPLTISTEDVRRAALYASRSAAAQTEGTFSSYEDYLHSLEMNAEVDAFNPTYLDRITQLTNKTNQFNLTTRRYSSSEMARIASDPSYLTLYVKLSDRFGDHGLISVVVGKREETSLQIDLWLMSCRVLKRGVELLVLDELAARAKKLDLKTIRGSYIRTPKNDMVSQHYPNLGFLLTSAEIDRSEFVLQLSEYQAKNRIITSHDSTGNPRPVTADIS